jgi:hypothetical protein
VVASADINAVVLDNSVNIVDGEPVVVRVVVVVAVSSNVDDGEMLDDVSVVIIIIDGVTVVSVSDIAVDMTDVGETVA